MRNGDYLTKSAYIKMWERVLREMQVHFTEPIIGLTPPHVFRHNYCASLCYKIPEISIPKIAELMGDSEKMVIEVYNHESLWVTRKNQKKAENPHKYWILGLLN